MPTARWRWCPRMIFGQAGNDTEQGDGSIDYVSHLLIDNGLGAMVVDPNDRYGGRVGVVNVGANIAGNPFRDATNALFLRPSFDGGTGDGQDYIEGNAGKDILFGNQNQDDLVGGNSTMASRQHRTATRSGWTTSSIIRDAASRRETRTPDFAYCRRSSVRRSQVSRNRFCKGAKQ